MKYLTLLGLLTIGHCSAVLSSIVVAAEVTVAMQEPCALEKQNSEKWHRMLNKASLGEYQEYLAKRYRLAQQEYAQCLHRGKQNAPATN